MVRARVTDSNDWFNVWLEDRECILNTMVRNMSSDLRCGYDYFGNCIAKQRREIENYKAETDRTIDMFKIMDDKDVNKWCFYDMKKRGVIE